MRIKEITIYLYSEMILTSEVLLNLGGRFTL
jgi:hypothetical protein